jgi:hypothetical protein
LYVVLNNLDADYHAAGPGFLARIDPKTRAVTLVNLGADACLNPQSAAEVGTGLVVSCVGQARYSGPFMGLQGADHGGLVLLDANDHPTATWASPVCAPDAGTSCTPMLPGRVAVAQQRVFLADQNGGRVVAFTVADGGLTEERTVQACTLSPVTGLADVGDVLVTQPQ